MALLVVGSVAFDCVETPHGKVDDAMGGSASYFSYAASYFTQVRLVGVVGTDFPEEFKAVLRRHNIDMSGLQVAEGKSFRWSGVYDQTMNQRTTRSVELNVFGSFDPKIPEGFRDTEYLFLANGSPVMQKRVLEQMKGPKLAVADTMNHWIADERPQLLDLMERIDGIVVNDEEARLLTGLTNLVAAGRAIRKMGPRIVIVKKGEHGSILFGDGFFYAAPAYPLEDVKDPTGAGDSFGGGMMGYLAQTGDLSPSSLKKAILYGTVCASFTVEDFSLNRLQQIERRDVDARYREFVGMLRV
jgi:sugar/nucleoside kinase (ribokinase family)